VTASADGSNLAAVRFGGPIFISTNSGTTWAQATNAPSGNWLSIASSADGTRLTAVVNGGRIYASTDSGTTWTLTDAPGESWLSIVSSADGGKLNATIYGGGIFTSQSTVAPRLNVAPANNRVALAWTIPSANFVLQQKADLGAASWVTLTNTPVLNLTNLQDEIAFLPTNDSGFFRLKSE